MGVPGLFYWIQQRHSKFTRTIPKEQNCVDNLYVDAVCFVHTCAQLIYGYGKDISASETFASLSPKEKEVQLFRSVRNSIFRLTKYVTPNKRFYVVFDGVAPIAKQNQQRHRRFLGGKPDCGFDPNSITCGTEFLDRLQRYVSNGLSNFCQREKFELVFSSSSEAGEGEPQSARTLRERTETKSRTVFIRRMETLSF
ncbi:XRN1 5'-3' exonuclease [Golden Marseillevirus]|uniref:XRN1 5'-3' exonuclease n=1 Tax=Golden Marseillevirus TaxID=1720526 RepID=UPI000877A889|nr:XRN1 5'-3' exonuclease [Golden Marseillevirus]ALX27586.1 XRN1 5'-3' exonuclease [Golden Marseillevirus]